MVTTKWTRVATVLLAAGILGIAGGPAERAAVAQSAAKDENSAPAPVEARKADLFGDPLPDGARARMGTLRWRHNSPVTFVGFASKGKHLVTACADGFFRVWEVASGKEIRRFGQGPDTNAVMGGGFGGAVGRVRFYGPMGGDSTVLSADGLTLAAAGPDGIIRLWDVSSGKEIRTIGNQRNPNVRGFAYNTSLLAFSPDGKALATRSSDQVIHLWNVATGKPIRQIGKIPAQQGNRIRVLRGIAEGMVFSPNGESIVSAGMELDNQMRARVLRFFDVDTGKELRKIMVQQNNFTTGGLAFAPDGKTLAWAGANGTVLYEAASGKEMRKLGPQQQGVVRGVLISMLVFSPNSKILATQATNSAAIHLWDVDNGKELGRLGEQSDANAGGFRFVRFTGFVGGSTTIAFSPDGKTLAESTSGNTVRLWKVAGGKEILPARGHHLGVSQMAVSPDAKVLTTLAVDLTIRQWEAPTGKELRQFQLPPYSVLAAGGKVVASHAANSVRLWDVAAGKEIRTIQLPAQQPGLGGLAGNLALSPDSKLLAVRGSDQAIRLFETTGGKELRLLVEQSTQAAPNRAVVFSGAISAVQSPMAFSPDGTKLATVVGTQRGMGRPVGVVRLSPQDGASNAIHLWDVARGKHPRRFETQKAGIVALAFLPDGRTIVTANRDNTISLWEALTGKECFQIKLTKDEKPAQPANAQIPLNGGRPMLSSGIMPSPGIAVSPDGRTLAVGGADRSVRLWDLESGKELGQFKGHEGSVLTVAFAPNSQTIFSGSADTTALVWDGAGLIKKHPAPTIALDAQQVDDLWQDLSGDPVRACKVIGTLAKAPKQAVVLFRDRVKPAADVDAQRLNQWIADLESAKFPTRQKATAALEKLGELAQPALQKALESKSSLEMRRRVERLLDQIVNDQTPPPEVQRALRAVEVLERLATPEARQLLHSLAKGAPGDKLTREAEASLIRLGK